ncbi:MAG: hydantoinase B/oxoprolinase family protein [Pseudomonadota bacterium]
MDDLTLDILWDRLIGTVNEQAAALIRASFTSIVREAGDLSAGVFDRQGRMVAQAVTGTPGHINSMATGMVHLLARHPVDSLAEGDVLITNDPWLTASQLNDITIATPVFRAGRCVAFFASCCHALDIGGRGLSADSRSVFEEGLAIPILKLHEAGRPVQPILDIIAANSRTPDAVLGDLHSQVVANAVGARQLMALMDEFALADLEAVSTAIIERTARATQAAIAALPDGTASARLQIDGFAAPITIAVAVQVAGEALTVDFAGSSEAVDRGINVTLNYTRAYTTYGIKCALCPEVPNNHGALEAIRITAPRGSILNARRPAAVGGRHLVGHFLPSAIMTALADLLPARVAAPGADGLWDTHIAGEDRAGHPFSFTWFSSGGVGAMQGRDGLSATAYPSGIAGVPVEIIETRAPLVIGRRALVPGSGGDGLVPGSGGDGQWRSGLGQEMTVEVLSDRPFLFSGLYERIAVPAPGLAGGGDGAPGRLTAMGPDGTAVAVAPKITAMLPAGTIVHLVLPGGGGFGPPEARDPDARARDLAEGYVPI